MERNSYELIEMIGVGSYGQVYKAKEKITGRNVAVKMIKKKPNPSDRERKEQKSFLKECNIHSCLGHPNIIRMLYSFEDMDCIWVVTELAGVDLHRFMSKHKLHEKHVQKLSWHILSALYYLHSHRVSHRDLKPQNILLNNYQNIDEMEAKICDFGLARKMTSETYLLTSVKGTPLYMAPEVMVEDLYDESADLWSVGCIIYEALFGTPPIKTQNLSQLLKWHRNPEIVWPVQISEESKSFLKGLLRKEPKMRFTWPQILEHPYVKNNLVIISDNNKSERPLTDALTASQQVRKEKQRNEIIFNRDKKMIADAISKCQQVNPNILQKPLEMGQQQQKRKPSNVIEDNESISSDDSVNAIIQTDLETDVEGPLLTNKGNRRPIENCEKEKQNKNFVINRLTDNFSEVCGREDKDNANLKIGTMLENIEKMQLEDENKWCTAKAKQIAKSVSPAAMVDGDNSRNPGANNLDQVTSNQQTDSMKRKLSNNLSNLSIRLGNEEEFDKDSSKEKPQSVRSINQKGAACSDDQSPPIENEEWLAFIRLSMQEVLNGETESLKHQNLVGIIVAILRNLNASSKVIGSVVQLLSIPFVLSIPSDDITQISTVYVQTKLLPNLIFASKIVCMFKGNNASFSTTLSSSNFATLGMNQKQDIFKRISDLSGDQLKTLTNIYELVCYLIHLNENFLSQFCDSVYIIANDLLQHFLSDENAEVVESIIFHESVDIKSLLLSGNVILQSRLCNLLRIVGRFCCFALRKVWTIEFKQALEGLLDNDQETVKEAARNAVDELSKLSFYNLPIKPKSLEL